MQLFKNKILNLWCRSLWPSSAQQWWSQVCSESDQETDLAKIWWGSHM